MEVKLFELRDRATFIPIFAFRVQPNGENGNRYLIRRAGFGPESTFVILGRLDCSGVDRNCTYDPHAWGGRTFPVAHAYIEEHFNELKSGSVIDVEFILGETETSKHSEAIV